MRWPLMQRSVLGVEVNFYWLFASTRLSPQTDQFYYRSSLPCCIYQSSDLVQQYFRLPHTDTEPWKLKSWFCRYISATEPIDSLLFSNLEEKKLSPPAQVWSYFESNVSRIRFDHLIWSLSREASAAANKQLNCWTAVRDRSASTDGATFPTKLYSNSRQKAWT